MSETPMNDHSDEPHGGTISRAQLDRLRAACKPDPQELVQVTMTRARWSAMLDHLNAELQPKLAARTATPEETDIVIHLACALISAAASRAEHELVGRMLHEAEVPR